jgi:hypothetical protein
MVDLIYLGAHWILFYVVLVLSLVDYRIQVYRQQAELYAPAEPLDT